MSLTKLVSGFNLTLQHTLLLKCICDELHSTAFGNHQWSATTRAFLFWVSTLSHRGNLSVHKLCVCDCVIERRRGGSRQCKSLPACHLAPAGVMLWHIGKWGGRVDKDFNRILKWVMVAFMCVIVTYPKVTAPKRHHPSPACLPHASFCLTDSLKLCLFVCSQSHFHLWSSWAWAAIACRAVLFRDRQTGPVN